MFFFGKDGVYNHFWSATRTQSDEQFCLPKTTAITVELENVEKRTLKQARLEEEDASWPNKRAKHAHAQDFSNYSIYRAAETSANGLVRHCGAFIVMLTRNSFQRLGKC